MSSSVLKTLILPGSFANALMFITVRCIKKTLWKIIAAAANQKTGSVQIL